MSNVIVIGAGMVGSAMAIDMAKNHQVTLTDLSPENLKKAQLKCADLSLKELDVCDKESLSDAIQPYDLVICAVPGFLGYQGYPKTLCTSVNENVVHVGSFTLKSELLKETLKVYIIL